MYIHFNFVNSILNIKRLTKLAFDILLLSSAWTQFKILKNHPENMIPYVLCVVILKRSIEVCIWGSLSKRNNWLCLCCGSVKCHRSTNLFGNDDVTHPRGLIWALIVQTHYPPHTHTHETQKGRKKTHTSVLKHPHYNIHVFSLTHLQIHKRCPLTLEMRNAISPYPFNFNGPFGHPCWVITGKIHLNKRAMPAAALHKEAGEGWTRTKSNTFA